MSSGGFEVEGNEASIQFKAVEETFFQPLSAEAVVSKILPSNPEIINVENQAIED